MCPCVFAHIRVYVCRIFCRTLFNDLECMTVAKVKRDVRLDTRSARSAYTRRREPYWRTLSKKKGWALGYRKGPRSGTWIAKHYNRDHGRRFKPLGRADDDSDVQGEDVLTYEEAEKAAREWFKELVLLDSDETERAASYSVNDALDDYLKDYTRRGGKSLGNVKNVFDLHVRPELGDIEITKLTKKQVRTWRDKIADQPALIRTQPNKPQRHKKNESPEARRQRRSTTNRVLSHLKAALNTAHQNDHALSADAWAGVKPFKNVDAPRVRYLTDDESTRLVNTCPPDFRALVVAALLTGARYGEITALKVNDFDPDSGTLLIALSKSGRARHVVLTDEAQDFFRRETAGKAGADLIFTRKSGKAWMPSDQGPRMRRASEVASIEPAVTFHILRHSHASRLAMHGAPMGVIAHQLGHADTRMTERHYAHLAPSYIADTVRAAFGELGIVETDNVKALK